MYSKMTDSQFQLQTLIARHCLAWIPDTSDENRGYEKGLGNSLARKCLAGMPLFLNPENFVSDLQHDWSGTIYRTSC